jgi:hypothetical protein
MGPEGLSPVVGEPVARSCGIATHAPVARRDPAPFARGADEDRRAHRLGSEGLGFAVKCGGRPSRTSPPSGYRHAEVLLKVEAPLV